MRRLRSPLLLAALAVAGLATAPSAFAVVGGHDVAPGGHPYVADIVIDGLFECTGTLVHSSRGARSRC